MEPVRVKEETLELAESQLQSRKPRLDVSNPVAVIDLSSSSSSGGRDSDDEDDDDDGVGSTRKRSRFSDDGRGGPPSKKSKPIDYVLPAGFLDPLPPDEPLPLPEPETTQVYRLPLPEAETALVSCLSLRRKGGDQTCKQFWKAGDYEGNPTPDSPAAPGNLSSFFLLLLPLFEFVHVSLCFGVVMFWKVVVVGCVSLLLFGCVRNGVLSRFEGKCKFCS